jgi:hypothetical protein
VRERTVVVKSAVAHHDERLPPAAAGCRVSEPKASGAAMTILRLDNSLAAELLLAHLCDSTDIAAEAVDPFTLRASVVGSYRAETMELALILRVRAWQAALRGKGVEVSVELVDERAS